MSKKPQIKATKPLEPYDGPGAIPQHRDEAALRAAQASGKVGQYVAFTYPDGTRTVGLCVACAAQGKDGATGIPDFDVTVRSLRDKDFIVYANYVKDRCQFYGTAKEAREAVERDNARAEAKA